MLHQLSPCQCWVSYVHRLAQNKTSSKDNFNSNGVFALLFAFESCKADRVCGKCWIIKTSNICKISCGQTVSGLLSWQELWFCPGSKPNYRTEPERFTLTMLNSIENLHSGSFSASDLYACPPCHPSSLGWSSMQSTMGEIVQHLQYLPLGVILMEWASKHSLSGINQHSPCSPLLYRHFHQWVKNKYIYIYI